MTPHWQQRCDVTQRVLVVHVVPVAKSAPIASSLAT